MITQIKSGDYISINSTLTREKGAKRMHYMYLNVNGRSINKCVNGLELKQLAGVKRINQTKQMTDWLNTDQGRQWANTTSDIREDIFKPL